MEDKKIEISSLTNEELIKELQIVEAFIKFVEDEIKKTDIGDKNEQ